MRTKVLIGLFAVVVSFFLWFIHNGLKSTIQKSDDLNNKIEVIEEVINEKKLNDSNPLEKAYKRLALLMERTEALDIMEKEYPKQPVDIASNQYTREYAWRWTWSNNETAKPEKASLTIYFTRKGDCVIGRVGNAVYAYERGDKKEKKSLLDKIKRL